ncbi:hypothetical protein J6590_106817, partial [Homalodisca vitripennis]
MEGQSNPIYVNNSLTQANRKLLNTAREVKREKQYTYLWVRNGRIFMRKNPGDRFVVIDSMEVLRDFLLFADDVKLFGEVASYQQLVRLQEDLMKIEEWCVLNGMDLNPTKCL